jgi:hypothetical protein
MPTAASQIWPHLPHDDERVAKQSKRTVADSLWPGLSREAKQREADQALWDAICERNRQSLLRNLREPNARMRREGR